MLSPYHEHHFSDLSVLLYSFHHVSNHHVLTIPGTSCKKSSCWNPIMLVIIILTSVQCTSCKWSLCLNQLVFFLTIYSLCHSSSCIQQCALYSNTHHFYFTVHHVYPGIQIINTMKLLWYTVFMFIMTKMATVKIYINLAMNNHAYILCKIQIIKIVDS